jgi:hypothetical protein
MESGTEILGRRGPSARSHLEMSNLSRLRDKKASLGKYVLRLQGVRYRSLLIQPFEAFLIKGYRTVLRQF